MAIHFERASNGYDVYNVDDVARTCTCPDFKFRAKKNGEECKHLAKHLAPPKETPSFTVRSNTSTGNATFSTGARPASPIGTDARVIEVTADGSTYEVALVDGEEVVGDLFDTLIALADKGHDVSVRVTSRKVTVF